MLNGNRLTLGSGSSISTSSELLTERLKVRCLSLYVDDGDGAFELSQLIGMNISFRRSRGLVR